MAVHLTPAQSTALHYIERNAHQGQTLGERELANVLAMSNIHRETFDEAVQHIKDFARVGLQFHPDRLAKNGRTVVHALVEEGIYKNQFETHVSNGKLDPLADGMRANWEDTMFGDAFRTHAADLSERPKYGALHLMLHPDGPSPRYGSCYMLLNPLVSRRCSFTYMDSHRNPPEKGTMNVFEPIMAALMTECFERRFALGTQNMSPTELICHLLQCLKGPFENPATVPPGRNLNHYIEAQVHGEVSLMSDAEIVVADPCFQGTPVEDDIQRLCTTYALDLYWHGGFRLLVDDVPDDFRGPTMRSLARRIAEARMSMWL